MPTIQKRNKPTIQFIGATGSGKTSLENTIYFAILHNRLEQLALDGNPSDKFLEQYEHFCSGEFFDRTQPTVGQLLDDVQRKCESLCVRSTDFDIPIELIAEAGEEVGNQLRAGHYKDFVTFGRRFQARAQNFLAYVMNPMLVSSRTARNWAKAQLAWQMEFYLSHDRTPNQPGPQVAKGKASRGRTGVETMGLALFGIPAEGTKESRGLHDITRDVFRNLPEDARFVCNFKDPDPETRFSWQSSDLSPDEARRALEAIHRLADEMVARQGKTEVSAIALAKGAEQMALLITRWDITKLLKDYLNATVAKEECLEKLGKTIPRERVFLLDHVSMTFETDWRKAAVNQQDAVRINTAAMEDKGGNLQKFAGAIVEFARKHKRPELEAIEPAVPVNAVSKQSDHFTTAAWKAMRAAPWILIGVLIVALALHGTLNWDSLWRFLLGGALLLAAAWVGFLYFAKQGLAWRVVESEDAQKFAVIGTLSDAPLRVDDKLIASETAVSGLFDIGWVTSGDKRVAIPRFKSFLAQTGLQLEEAPAIAAWDALQVIVLATGCVLAAGSFLVTGHA